MYPTNDNCLVYEVAQETQTAGGLILTGSIETGSKPGMIAAVGPEVDGNFLNQKCFVNWGKGMPVTVEGKMAVLVKVEYVLALID